MDSPHSREDAAANGDSGTRTDSGSEAPPGTQPDADVPATDGGDRAPDAMSSGPGEQPKPADAGTKPTTPDASSTQGDDAGHDHPSDDGGTERDAATTDLICSSCGRCEEVFPLLSRDHTTNAIYYADPPPTNGPHNPCWARWGVHPTEVLDDRWVHNLEHGGVIYLYNCPDGCPTEVAALERMATTRRRTLLTPYAALPTRFGIVAWSHRLLTDCLDEAAFSDFYDKNFDHGWESLDDQPDVSCPP